MKRNYGSYRSDIAETLMEVDNIIEKTELEIKELEEKRKKVLNDPESVEDINEFIKIKKTDLTRFEQNLKDALNDYE
ncbi:MAG: hypothetical protein KAV87_04340 [Desulfobacteraceae bacterium]|nr:hypothetical protein [Desulfobacteraceae bacterium]